MKYNPEDIFEYLSFIKIDKSLNNLNRLTASVALKSTDYPMISSIDMNDKITNLLISELNQMVYKNIVEDIMKDYDFKCINLIGEDIESLKSIREITSNLNEISGYKFSITSGMMQSNISDAPGFNRIFQTANLKKINAIPYLVGNLNNIECYVDPFMRYNDNTIYLFNDIRINIDNVEITFDQLHSSSARKIRIDFDLGYVIDKPMAIFVLDSVNSKGYKEYTQLNRNIKINDLLK